MYVSDSFMRIFVLRGSIKIQFEMNFFLLVVAHLQRLGDTKKTVKSQVTYASVLHLQLIAFFRAIAQACELKPFSPSHYYSLHEYKKKI